MLISFKVLRMSRPALEDMISTMYEVVQFLISRYIEYQFDLLKHNIILFHIVMSSKAIETATIMCLSHNGFETFYSSHDLLREFSSTKSHLG